MPASPRCQDAGTCGPEHLFRNRTSTLKLSVKKSIDVFALSLYIDLFQGQSEDSRSRSETPTCEAKSGK